MPLSDITKVSDNTNSQRCIIIFQSKSTKSDRRTFFTWWTIIQNKQIFLNGIIHTECAILKHVVASADGAEYWWLVINTREGKIMCLSLALHKLNTLHSHIKKLRPLTEWYPFPLRRFSMNFKFKFQFKFEITCATLEIPTLKIEFSEEMSLVFWSEKWRGRRSFNATTKKRYMISNAVMPSWKYILLIYHYFSSYMIRTESATKISIRYNTWCIQTIQLALSSNGYAWIYQILRYAPR